MLIDTHAHLHFPEFHDDLAAVLDRARAAGVGRVITIATELASARASLQIAAAQPGVFAAVGLHPNNVPESSLCDLGELRALATAERVVAIGETGLDYFREARDNPALRQQQKDLFWAQLDLAGERSLPVVIHNRAADEDLLEIVRAHAANVPAERRPWGVLHCFTGDVAFATECLALGLLISYTGILTFPKSAALRDVARAIPLEQVMIETDAPYLAPVPHRGQRNEPAYVAATALALAQARGVSVEEVARATTATAQRLFGIE